MFKELLDKHKGKIVIAILTAAVGFGGAYAGVKVDSKEDGKICIAIEKAQGEE